MYSVYKKKIYDQVCDFKTEIYILTFQTQDFVLNGNQPSILYIDFTEMAYLNADGLLK